MPYTLRILNNPLQANSTLICKTFQTREEAFEAASAEIRRARKKRRKIEKITLEEGMLAAWRIYSDNSDSVNTGSRLVSCKIAVVETVDSERIPHLSS